MAPAGVDVTRADLEQLRVEDRATVADGVVVAARIADVGIDRAEAVDAECEVALPGRGGAGAGVAGPASPGGVRQRPLGRHHHRGLLRGRRVRRPLGHDVETGHAAVPVDPLHDAVAERLRGRSGRARVDIARVAAGGFGAFELGEVGGEHLGPVSWCRSTAPRRRPPE